MRQVGDVPEHDVLLLHALIIVIVSQLIARSKTPRHVFAGIGSANCHIDVRKPVSFAIIFERHIARARENPHAMAIQLIAHE